MNSNKKIARIAGLLYFGVVITGIFSLMYVPGKLLAAENSAEIIENIRGNLTLFRLGLISGLLCYTFFLFLPLVLYKLLKSVNENYALIMVILAVISVPIYFLNAQNYLSVLSILKTPSLLDGFSILQIQSQIMLHLEQFDNGMRIVHVFSGLWLFPFGYLVFKSGFLPKILGILLMIGCFGYLINFLGSSLFSNYYELGISSYISLPASLGEIGTCLWLLFVGVKQNNKI